MRIELAEDLNALDELIADMLPRLGPMDAEALEYFQQRYWPAAREVVTQAHRELLERINVARDWLLATDEWGLIDEGKWEEFARETGAFWGNLTETRVFAEELEKR